MKIKLLFLFVVLIFFDQILKYLSTDSICNPNIAWSVPISPAIFYLVWSLIMIFLLYLIFKTKSYIQKFFTILILSGAISNMIDRIRLGCVVDYIDLKFWPVFNLADVYITLGIILIVLNIIRNKNTDR
ncbi:MAG: signal peptidase II [Candidatus Moranbacteria bacterium]|nr:signal peptidase II [Candidatus Moranbacteria bacterium]